MKTPVQLLCGKHVMQGAIGNKRCGARAVFGLSLIEVVIAVGLLALIMGSTASLMSQGYLYASKVKTRVFVNNLLRQELEDASIWTGGSSPPPFDTPPASKARADITGFAGFERQVTVTNPYLGENSLAFINVTVWWNNGTNSVSVGTMKADY